MNLAVVKPLVLQGNAVALFCAKQRKLSEQGYRGHVCEPTASCIPGTPSASP